MRKLILAISLLSLCTVAGLAEVGSHQVLDVDIASIDSSVSLGVTMSTVAINGGTIDTITNDVSIDDGGNVITVADSAYEGKVSTGTSGLLTSSQTLSPSFDVTSYSFFPKGGDTEVTASYMGTIIYIPQDSSVSPTVEIPVSTTFDVSLTAGTTVYYIINGTQ